MAQIRVFHSIEFINISLFERHLVSRERLQGKYSSLVGWLNNFLFFLFLAPYLYSPSTLSDLLTEQAIVVVGQSLSCI